MSKFLRHILDVKKIYSSTQLYPGVLKMKKMYKSRQTRSAAVSSAAKLFVVVLTCCAIKAASSANISFNSNYFGSNALSLFTKAVLSLEFPQMREDKPNLLAFELPLVTLPEKEAVQEEITVPEKAQETSPSKPAEEPQNSEIIEPAAEDTAIDTTITGATEPGYQYVADDIYIKNTTGYDIDVEALLSSDLGFSAAEGAEVLIVHTHGTEAYSQADGDTYEESDPSRTLDKEHNVVRVGDKLAEILTERGITVIHDTTLYDYPDYNSSYTNAGEGIFSAVSENSNIKVVIDLHRDALEDADGTIYKTVADIGDEPCSQVMLVVGTDYSGLKHDYWQENLKFALKLQAQMVTQYPSLARPLNITKYRYNQHATTGSLIVEVGCSGNTLSESLNAITYFADCLADVLGA